MKALKFYWAKGGKQKNIKIGDNIKDVFKEKEDLKDFQRLDETFNTEKMLEDLKYDFHLKKKLLDGNCMKDSCIYMCNESGTIKGMIPINIKN